MLKRAKPGQQLTLKGSQLPPAREEPQELLPGRIQPPPTMEEEAYQRALEINPHLSELAKRLALVSSKFTPHPPGAHDLAKLQEIATKALEPERMYTPEQVLQALQDTYQLPLERAQKGLEDLASAGVLAPIIGKTHYYLASSTPF
jgi:hypothetical protein